MMRGALLLALLLAAPAPAWAHKIRLFATAEGTTISGYAYFSGGARAQEATVTAVAAGRTVFTGRTDAQGAFAFQTATQADHLLRVDSGDGHAAAFTVRMTESPQSPPAAEAPPVPDAAAAEMIERAVARQIRPLREQLDAYEQTVRLRDALGGLGFIIGLGGLAYGLSARKEGKKP